MAGLKPTRDRAVWPGFQLPWPRATLVVFVVTTAVCLLALVALVPPILVLPAVSLTAIGGGAVVALFAWWFGAERRSSHVTSWDVAGALVFIGVSAGMLADSEQLVQFFGHATMPR